MTTTRCTCHLRAPDGAPVGCYHDNEDRPDTPAPVVVETAPATPAPEDEEEF